MAAAQTARRALPADEAWGLMGELWHVHRCAFFTAAAEFELSPPQAMALRALPPGEPMAMSALAEHLRCDNSNVTGIVDRLESRGLVERRPADHDRRVKHLSVTADGASIREAFMARMQTAPAALSERLDAGEQRALRNLLRKALAE